MNFMMYIYYFIGINVITYIVFFFDKKQAIRDKYRVSEKFLLTLVSIGGTIGAISSMMINRHKIKKQSFIFKYIGANILFVYLSYEMVSNT